MHDSQGRDLTVASIERTKWLQARPGKMTPNPFGRMGKLNELQKDAAENSTAGQVGR